MKTGGRGPRTSSQASFVAQTGKRLMAVTDLDGSLLDEHSYDFEPARPALDELARLGGVLVLASSKTQAEMEVFAHRIGRVGAMIAENGAVLLVPRGKAFKTLAGGVRRSHLVRALEEIRREARAELRGFSTFTAAQLSTMTGLSTEAARLALERHFDEPFLLDDPAAAPAVSRAASRRGLVVTRGGRFFHLTGRSDKGSALRQLLARWAGGGPWLTVGLGDAANDLPLLRFVDRPIVVPGPDGIVRRELRAALPGAECAPAPGPRGWNAAVLRVIGGGSLPTVAEAGRE